MEASANLKYTGINEPVKEVTLPFDSEYDGDNDDDDDDDDEVDGFGDYHPRLLQLNLLETIVKYSSETDDVDHGYFNDGPNDKAFDEEGNNNTTTTTYTTTTTTSYIIMIAAKTRTTKKIAAAATAATAVYVVT